VILEFDLLLSHTNRPYANRLLSLIVCGGAFVVPLRAQTVSAAPPVQTAAVSSSQEEAELVGQLNALIATDDAATNELGAEGIVPLTKGFNASFVTTSQHDSTNGWSSLMTPNIAYRFDRHFSLNVGLPVYNYIDVDIVTPTKTVKGW
jgi:hypothetical protein